jgi:hypothetical protein
LVSNIIAVNSPREKDKNKAMSLEIYGNGKGRK